MGWQPWSPLGQPGASLMECRCAPAPDQPAWTPLHELSRDSSPQVSLCNFSLSLRVWKRFSRVGGAASSSEALQSVHETTSFQGQFEV